ncbi:hypothetical protein MC885_004472 [Smutsia gigantea]|nr:hypothetical protein MC885_004472 [Smutsia gigantea]
MPESFHSRRMMSDISLGIAPSSVVSAMCSSLRASSWGAPPAAAPRRPPAHLARRVSVLDVERGHGAHDGQDGLQRVAVDDGNELQALFQRVPVLVDDPEAGRAGSRSGCQAVDPQIILGTLWSSRPCQLAGLG